MGVQVSYGSVVEANYSGILDPVHKLEFGGPWFRYSSNTHSLLLCML